MRPHRPAVGYSGNPDWRFGGQIDELRVWDGALDEQAVAALCPAPDPLSQDLELHWTFEDRVGDQITDISGNARHGTNTGGSFVPSAWGEALAFDGVDDKVNFVGPRALELYGGEAGSFTFSTRVKVSDLDRYNTLSFGAGPFKSLLLGHPVRGGEVLATSTWLGDPGNVDVQLLSEAALVNDTWTELTYIVEGGVDARIYADCQPLQTSISLEGVTTSEVGLVDPNFSSLGFSGVADRWFGGELEDLRVWSRALSEEDLVEICAATPPPDPCEGPILVDIDAPPNGDGTSWASAFDTVQDAIDTAAACTNPEIWVAEGTYAPDPSSSVAQISTPLSLYGGFAGTEDTLEQRDIQAHPTRLGAPGWQARIVSIESSAINFVDPVRVDGFTSSGSEAGVLELVSPGNPENTADTVVFLHNLEVLDNSADEGGGFKTRGWVGVDVRNCHFEGNSAPLGAAIYNDESSVQIFDSSFVANSSNGGAVHQISFGGFSFFGGVSARDSSFSDNVGGAMHIASGTITRCTFANNSASEGGAIKAVEGGVQVIESMFTNNTASYGGALLLERFASAGGRLTVTDSSFVNNQATVSGGAIYAGSGDFVDPTRFILSGSSFETNSAYFGGAVYLAANDQEFGSSVFRDNTAARGGAVYVASFAELRDSRFVSNDAQIDNGGAVYVAQALGAALINDEFVANTAVSNGGAVFGRADVTSSSFADNSAGNLGDALYAPNGELMTLRSVVAWPDTIAATTVELDHACVAAPLFNYTNTGTLELLASPFAPADLDLDGDVEQYLDPASPCVDLGGTVEAFDWTALTTQSSQCSDSGALDAGVHYTPQSAVGPC